VSKLKRRVGNVGGNHAKAMAAYTPVEGSTPVTGSAASPGGAPGVMPLASVTVYPQPGGQYSTIAYQGLAPIFTSGSLGGGAAVPATSPGRWAQLVSAGRP
jgi:hypothetical protein